MRTKTSVCRSNLRQFGIAQHLYLGDFHAYPTGGGERWLKAFIGEHVRPEILACPLIIGNSYSHNRWGSTPLGIIPHLGLGPDANGKARRDTEVAVPSDFTTMFDTANLIQPPNLFDPPLVAPSHGSSFNLLFADGHVRSILNKGLIRPDQSYKSKWNINRSPHDEYWPDK